MPKASAREFHHQQNASSTRKPSARFLTTLEGLRRLLYGANPVASALGNPARRDPGEAVRTYHEG